MSNYIEHENLIYLAQKHPKMDAPLIQYYIRAGKWAPCKGGAGTAARAFGTPMDEDEARKFQGEGWPAEPPPAA